MPLVIPMIPVCVFVCVCGLCVIHTVHISLCRNQPTVPYAAAITDEDRPAATGGQSGVFSSQSHTFCTATDFLLSILSFYLGLTNQGSHWDPTEEIPFVIS